MSLSDLDILNLLEKAKEKRTGPLVPLAPALSLVALFKSMKSSSVLTSPMEAMGSLRSRPAVKVAGTSWSGWERWR